LLEELGRGGMGVVYKARQVGLNRLVALKMILSGGHASPRERARFRAEAEAVARLSHSNIVSVFEVGEHQGHPFLALEYVAGGSLAQRLQGTPLAPRRAAELLVALARAAHAAHERGVVHRDLKPANVLLQEGGIRDQGSGIREEGQASSLIPNPQSLIPKITDFGLAKRLDEVGQTQTGAIMGTPSYMAPEQAAGQKDVGAPADVYALGATLYEMLTGRPPFKGTTVLETLEHVCTLPPVPPRALQPSVPRDLEVICLKCLEKRPADRYDSAAALAEDLQNFLAGEAIRARASGVLQRLVHTLEHRNLKIEFRTWGNLFLLFAPLALLTHLLLFALTRHGPPYPDGWIVLTVGAELTLMAALFWRFRLRTLVPLSVTERQLVSIWSAYLVAALLFLVVCYQTTPSGQTFDVLAVYPLWTILTGVMFYVTGLYWGPSYLTGLGCFALGVLMLLSLPWAPVEFGLAWFVYFVAAGLYLRRLGSSAS
jgi:hypothetical protein